MQQRPNLLYGLSCGLHFMVFVLAVNGTLRADGPMAGEAKVSELLLMMIRTRIIQLVSGFLGIGCVGRLRNGLCIKLGILGWSFVL